MNRIIIFCLLVLLFYNCNKSIPKTDKSTSKNVTETSKPKFLQTIYYDFFNQNPEYISDGFDFPVGKPDAKGYYNAQPFQKNNHLGDDWNATTGGNSDLGHPIYAISHGLVSEVKDYGSSWGNILRTVHQLPNGEMRESLYAHCLEIIVEEGDAIKKGQKVATIGNADGMYYAHLHLEMRWKIAAALGGGYSSDTTGYLDPTAFIRKFRVIEK